MSPDPHAIVDAHSTDDLLPQHKGAKDAPVSGISNKRPSWPWYTAAAEMDDTKKRLRPGEQSRFYQCVTGPRFQYITAIIIVVNAIFIGVQADFRARSHRESYRPSFFAFSEISFCVFFVVEITARIIAQGREFVCGDDWKWNLFDATIVFCQLFEQIVKAMGKHFVNLSSFRMLRVLRIFRVGRLLRVLHMFDELRQIMESMTKSASVLGWSGVMLGIVIYIFSVVVLQFVVDAGTHTLHARELQRYFGTLPRTVFTMFEAVVGGFEWDELVSPLMEDISPIFGFIFSIYIACCMFAVMNMLTGVFVDKAIQSVREDKDKVLAHNLLETFCGGEAEQNDITWQEFEVKLSSETMQDYLKQINMAQSEGEALFDLLDMRGRGRLNPGAIVDGCLRLRGPARSFEQALLMRAVGVLHDEFLRLRTCLEVLHKQ